MMGMLMRQKIKDGLAVIAYLNRERTIQRQIQAIGDHRTNSMGMGKKDMRTRLFSL